MINVGIVGYGYWGPNLVRNFSETPGSRVRTICELRKDKLDKAARRHPGISLTTEYKDLIGDPSLDAVVIATPVSAHFPLAMDALKAGKHVWVEKPIASSSDQARAMIDEAAKRKRVLLVDHTFVYTGAVRKIHDLITTGQLGDIYYYDSVRVNLGLFQHDVNVLWDLAVHDLSILAYLFKASPVAVSATGMSHVPGGTENIAYLTLFFKDNLIAHVHANWLAPAKVRRTLIGGSLKMIIYDDLEPSEKIKIYDKGITVSDSDESIYQMLISYRTGDMTAPRIDGAEALGVEAAHFVHCVEQGEVPITDGEAGLRVVRILEAASRSISKRGEAIPL